MTLNHRFWAPFGSRMAKAYLNTWRDLDHPLSDQLILLQLLAAVDLETFPRSNVIPYAVAFHPICFLILIYLR